MRILVTGGLGFIGSRLCNTLLDEGYGVRCVDDLSGSGAGGAPVAAETVIAPADPMHIVGVDAVIHLAALPGVRSRSTPASLRAANVESTDRLAATAAHQNKRFVFVSSSSVYGNARRLPTPEDAPLAPLNPYAASKVAAERAVLAHGGDPVIVRPFTVYGPGQRPDMAFARWIAAMQAGEAIPWHAAPGTARDFTYVDDAVAGLIAALEHGRAGQAYNISGWRSVELRDALALLGPPAVRELSCSSAEALVTSGCGRKAAAELGYTPRVELADGLRRQLGAVTSPSLAA
jgi:nucleoside-diphosphate-sugar epimerase